MVQPNAYLRVMNLGVRAGDKRCVEVLASGLSCYGGAQLAVDITIGHFLSAMGTARANAGHGGALLDNARGDKERKYQELVRARRCRLVVVALSTGGRWSSEALDFIHTLAWAKARSAPEFWRGSVAFSWQRRWTRMLSVAEVGEVHTAWTSFGRDC